ncbi:MAG: bifunctional alpha,alpha-trehalose-phosphate synthase (UDP-forming)/trehalose-phosphatase [Candidatus Desulfofervidus auxilii]|nr:bifunctional alpha,alpha-trehalose-phosphate synthase (UDP-forming)/trehalose-phosphatase [Candidatus Desulfofervidus auxilii]
MARLLIVSNRLPLTVIKREGKLSFQSSAGGLATGLGSFYKSYNALWIGWPGIALERLKGEEEKNIKDKLINEACLPIFLSQRNIENYYYGFCNKTIWPLFHYFPLYAVFIKNLWESYKRVNQTFCNTIINFAKPDDIIWIHDYHLMLLPKLIRERIPEATISFFLHIPFPAFEIFRLLPWRKEILDGLLGADLIGFHTYDYVRHFLDSVRRIVGHEHSFGHISVNGRIVKIDVFPMGIDYERFHRAVKKGEVQKEINKLRKKLGERRIILSVDRMDYTKGIPQRLEAFDLLLEKYPEYRGKVTFILVAVPSRTKVEHYTLLKKQVDELVGRINGKYGTIEWMPVWYLYRSLPFSNLVALYNIADVAFVTPLRDGMNLIAKEFVATKSDQTGVLILSEMAGAAKELGEAIIINPNNKEEMLNALKEALTMTEEEQKERNKIMQKRLKRYNVVKWANDFIDRLCYIKKMQQELCIRKLTSKIRKRLINDYLKSNKRLILLDYDGTLVPLVEKPENAKPDSELIVILKNLVQESKNEVVIISGRDKNTLEKWFGSLNLGLIAEHGVWIKDKKWEMIEPLKNDWKEQIKPILELYVDRTPGSFIEEKEFSLVWHYRKSDPELAEIRARELKDALLHLTANLKLEVLEGSKVIEIKDAGINKGRAALRWIQKEKWDFILAIGDDRTDEDVFAVLPKSAYSIKVGLSASQAKFNVDSQEDIRKLLRELEECAH